MDLEPKIKYYCYYTCNCVHRVVCTGCTWKLGCTHCTSNVVCISCTWLVKCASCTCQIECTQGRVCTLYSKGWVHVTLDTTHMVYSTVVLLMFFKMLADNVVIDTNPHGALTGLFVHVSILYKCTHINMHTLIHVHVTISSLSIILYHKEIHVYIRLDVLFSRSKVQLS